MIRELQAPIQDLIGNLNIESGYANENSTLGNPFADEEGHGTPVAGIIGAVGNNTVGISGVCWDMTLVSLKVSEYKEISQGVYAIKENLEYFIDALKYANENDIPILSFSGG